MKKENRSISWLYREFPELISEGILSEETTKKLKKRYGEVKSHDPIKIALIIFSIIGSVLIGGGIILILAHNWADMSRPVRAVFSLIPLLIAQVIAGYTLLKKDKSTAWKEGAGVFLMLALGSSIALIGQTYHVSGNLGSFLFTWMILSLPVIYLLNCTTAGLFYIAGITFWCGYIMDANENPLFYWLFLGSIVPHIIMSMRKNRSSLRSLSLLWGVVITLPIITGMMCTYTYTWPFAFAGLWAIFYLTGSLVETQSRFALKRPLHTIGALGLFVFISFFTYKEACHQLPSALIELGGFKADSIVELLIQLLPHILLALSTCILIFSIIKKRFSGILFGVFPLIMIAGGLLGLIFDARLVTVIIFNLYLAALGIHTIIRGIKEERLGKMNAGMFILSTLILLRFFDLGANILLRGISFIIIGIGFLAVNILIVKRQKRAGEERNEK